MQSSTLSEVSFPLPLPGSPFSDRDDRELTPFDPPSSHHYSDSFLPAALSPSSILAPNPVPAVSDGPLFRAPRTKLEHPSPREDECFSSVSVDHLPPPPLSSSSFSAPPKTATPDNKRLRRYVCTSKDCGKSFAKKWNLQAHERLHTGYKPFTCRLGCGERYMWMSSLKSHERRKCPLLPEPLRLRRKARSKKSNRSYAARKLASAPDFEQHPPHPSGSAPFNANTGIDPNHNEDSNKTSNNGPTIKLEQSFADPLYAPPTTSIATPKPDHDKQQPFFLPDSLLMSCRSSPRLEENLTMTTERVKNRFGTRGASPIANTTTEEQIVFELESILAK